MKDKNTTINEKWYEAMNDSLSRLKINKLQEKRLKRIIKLCKQKMASGEPWPGDEKAGTAAEAIPA